MFLLPAPHHGQKSILTPFESTVITMSNIIHFALNSP